MVEPFSTPELFSFRPPHPKKDQELWGRECGRAERAVATIKQILKKSVSDTDITKALITYLDTPVSDTLTSPAELFHNRRINTRLSMAMTPTQLTDQQKAHLADKRSALI